MKTPHPTPYRLCRLRDISPGARADLPAVYGAGGGGGTGRGAAIAEQRQRRRSGSGSAGQGPACWAGSLQTGAALGRRPGARSWGDEGIEEKKYGIVLIGLVYFLIFFL